MDEVNLCGRCCKPKKVAGVVAEAYCECGRPLKFKDAAELAASIESYFIECEREEDTRQYTHGETFEWEEKKAVIVTRCKECRGRVLDEYNLPTRGCLLISGKLKERITPTVTGLALWLDCEKETVKSYGERDEFSGPIKNAYLRIERELEEELHRNRVPPAKTIFGLSNFGWKNPQHIDHTVKVSKDGAAELAANMLQEGKNRDDT